MNLIQHLNVQQNKVGYSIDWLASEKNKTTSFIQTKWIIDATGRSSKVARLLGISKTKYNKQVQQIFKSNEKSRTYFYNQETRYREEQYWQQTLLVKN